MSSYNIHQKLYSLGLACNIATGCTGTQGELQQKMDDALQPSIDNLGIGRWNVVWGPAVWKLHPDETYTAADHIWFVARGADVDNGNSATYVIAIAGLAGKSGANWAEVLNTAQVVDFDAFCKDAGSPPVAVAPESIEPQKSYIALGIANGVYRLLNAASAGQGTTLPQFLESIPSDSHVIFTGQSLGGTLSSTLALTAVQAGMLKHVSPDKVFVYSVSSGTSGNRPLADLFAESFPLISVGENSYEVWNANIWNKYDIVPRFWNTGSVEEQNMRAILTVYGKMPEPLHLLVSQAIELMIAKHVRPSQVDYVPIQGMMFAPHDAPPTPKCLLCFIKTALTQHITAYVDFFGAPAPPPLCQASGLAEAPIISLFNDASMAVEEGEEGT